MDKKSLIGIVLIGLIFGSFMIIQNITNKKELENKAKNSFSENVKSGIDTNETTNIKSKNDDINQKKSITAQGIKDSLGNIVYRDSSRILTDTVLSLNENRITLQNKNISNELKEKYGSLAKFAIPETNKKIEYSILENDKIKLIFSNVGGSVVSAVVKGYKTFDQYQEDGYNKKGENDYLYLFKESGTKNGLSFNYEGRIVKTANLKFNLLEQKKDKLIYRLEPQKGKYIDYIYTITDDKNHIDFSIKFHNLMDEIDRETVMLNSQLNFLKTEHLLNEQRRISTVFYKNYNDKYDYLSESGSEKEVMEQDMDWVCFKQSYFSMFFMPEKPFKSEKSELEIYEFKEEKSEEKYAYNNYIKNYKAHLNLGIESTESSTTNLKWYFGPNDYELLSTYDNGAEDINNLGWGLFRWINVYVIQPLFQLLLKWGVSVGIAILLLTVIIKTALSPVTFKMYTSSAKMRLLKPQMDKIGEKYPKKEDAMKKQQEIMALQRESGASPLAGCIPMLIQMPILFAVFRFFPTTFTLRQEKFLWAKDLSSFDWIAQWSENIPIFSSIYGNHISLFTLLMAVTTLVYTHYNSGQMQQPQQEGMPNMKIIMYFFPVIMIFFFNNYASGLSYYYFISTLISIVIMISIKKWFVDEKKIMAKMEAKKAESNIPGTKKKKSGFAQRLEQMQKAQQEKLKNQQKR